MLEYHEISRNNDVSGFVGSCYFVMVNANHMVYGHRSHAINPNNGSINPCQQAQHAYAI